LRSPHHASRVRLFGSVARGGRAALPELLHVAERTLGAGYAVRDYGLLEAALARL
jgi:hypothetical protein